MWYKFCMGIIEPITPGSKAPKDRRDHERLKRSRELVNKMHPCGKFQKMLDDKLKEGIKSG